MCPGALKAKGAAKTKTIACRIAEQTWQEPRKHIVSEVPFMASFSMLSSKPVTPLADWMVANISKSGGDVKTPAAVSCCRKMCVTILPKYGSV